MPPASSVIPRFAAEPPLDPSPYGRWATRLETEFRASASKIGFDELDEVKLFPDRTWHGRTYVPAVAQNTAGQEIYGYLRFLPPTAKQEPSELTASVELADEIAGEHPEWRLDLCDEVIGSWRGEHGWVAAMTLVWGRALVAGGTVATAELGEVTVDQCTLVEDRFTLLAPDDYGGELLDVALFTTNGKEIARESLYADD